MKPLYDCIAEGREALAQGRGDLAVLAGSPVETLLMLLWHDTQDVRQAAARALPGGDRDHYHESDYGYFTEAFLRELTTRNCAVPLHPAERYGAAGEVLRDLIGQCTRDIRAMSGMHYSFLSSALYLTLFATCRDALLAAKRLRSSEVQEALCGLLWNLAAVTGTGRLNPTDTLLLMDNAGLALAFLPPDEIPAFWEALSHTNPTRRSAVSPALRHLADPRAVRHLLEALPLQQPEIAEPIVVCLGRLGDPLALPLLREYSQSSNRLLSRAARTAIDAIQRASKLQPVRTLLRPSMPDAQELLRSIGTDPEDTDALLRPRTEPEQQGNG
ncbi:MAG: hypothetical protein JWN14_3223 [Chthonomonadales bacterium]|nr:hypothetical protein [Chthonomonadales bacterium]